MVCFITICIYGLVLLETMKVYWRFQLKWTILKYDFIVLGVQSSHPSRVTPGLPHQQGIGSAESWASWPNTSRQVLQVCIRSTFVSLLELFRKKVCFMICRMDWDSYQTLWIIILLICLISFKKLQKHVFICFKENLLNNTNFIYILILLNFNLGNGDKKSSTLKYASCHKVW